MSMGDALKLLKRKVVRKKSLAVLKLEFSAPTQSRNSWRKVWLISTNLVYLVCSCRHARKKKSQTHFRTVLSLTNENNCCTYIFLNKKNMQNMTEYYNDVQWRIICK